MAYLAKIFIYPIKSLDPVSLKTATFLTSGAIAGDREWALFDQKKKFINGKNNPQVHLIRSSWNLDLNTVSLRTPESDRLVTFQIQQETSALESWFGEYFQCRVKLKQNTDTGYPDDTKVLGPTIISTATIETVASWFPQITVEEMRSRLRANLEIGGVPAFWEDRLFNRKDEAVNFAIGDVLLSGINPCQRCIVPTRDSKTGIGDPQFIKTFTTKRQRTLPPWTNRDRFNHFYRLSINTKVPASEAGKFIHLGDEVRV
ncbi:MAG: MOSC domain-containing protein [Pleurocapsa sp.]